MQLEATADRSPRTPLLHRKRAIAPTDYDRWLVPPAALAVELAIGQAYSLSVFNLPLTRVLGVDKSSPDDWSLSATIWMFSIAFFFVGATSALLGGWVERVGPRKSMFVSALCFAGGFFVSAVAVRLHVLLLLYAGYGVLGGIGLGIGYLSPVPTLLKWFPDRPGLATGMAVMGFGGGAIFGAPLAVTLMARFRTASSTGIAETFATMGAVYFVMMLFGAFAIRVPTPPPGLTISTAPEPPGLSAGEAVRTRAFWLVWLVLLTNVTAGIGILGQASPMIQEMFSTTSGAAVGFVGLLSLSNLAGRLGWSAASDRLGRKRAYALYLGLGFVLYALLPTTKAIGSSGVFVAATCIILSMYGGSFATAPAYLRDLFGGRQVGAIFGRLLTAWAAAAMIGPTLITYARDYQIHHGVPKAAAYSKTLYGLAALLVVGFVANLLVTPLPTQAHANRLPPPPAVPRPSSPPPHPSAPANASVGRPVARLVIYWAVVALPLGWGIGQVVSKASALFH